MDRRRTPRLVFRPHERLSAELTLLSADGKGDVSCAALVADWSGAGVRLVAPLRVPPGTPVRVVLPDRLALGDACYCQLQPDGQFAVGLRLSQVLDELSSLRRLAARLMGEPREERLPASHL